MPLDRANTPLNPTVEEVRDETESHNDSPASEVRLSWPEICAQHESVLASHHRMLQTLKGQISLDTEAGKVLSNMVDRTNKLRVQFEGLRKHIIPRVSRGDQFSGSGLGGGRKRTPSASTSGPDDDDRAKRRKRPRLSNHGGESEVESREPLLADTQRKKRKRMDTPASNEEQDVREVMPVAFETEDISDEVQRRLRIKEEQRRKRDAKPEKRKRDRDSLASNASSSSIGSMSKPRKKFKLSERVRR
ncbi:hypothetical protein BJX61DRAFT_105605 [Aspergillus egyptiacus]|nr:hypothetical protein BJX61DRAFT_105605 [Aspergillus egyptiacus]